MKFIFQQPYHYQRTGVRIIVLCPEITDTLESATSENSADLENLECPDFCEFEKNIHPEK